MKNKIPKHLAESTYGKEIQDIADSIGDIEWDECGAYQMRNGHRIDANFAFMYPHTFKPMPCNSKLNIKDI